MDELRVTVNTARERYVQELLYAVAQEIGPVITRFFDAEPVSAGVRIAEDDGLTRFEVDSLNAPEGEPFSRRELNELSREIEDLELPYVNELCLFHTPCPMAGKTYVLHL